MHSKIIIVNYIMEKKVFYLFIYLFSSINNIEFGKIECLFVQRKLVDL